jgi:hypothetical protein
LNWQRGNRARPRPQIIVLCALAGACALFEGQRLADAGYRFTDGRWRISLFTTRLRQSGTGMNYWRSLPAGFDRTAVIVIYAATPRANPGYLRFRERVRYVASRRLFRFSVACRIEFLESSPWMSSPYTMMPYTMISPMLMPMRSATEARRCPAEALDDHGIGQRANVRIHQQTSGCVGARAGRGSGREGGLGSRWRLV